MSGWSWIFPSHRAADDLDGSFWAGSERPARDGVHPAPTEEAMSVGTIVISEGLVQSAKDISQQIPNDLQSDPIRFGNP